MRGAASVKGLGKDTLELRPKPACHVRLWGGRMPEAGGTALTKVLRHRLTGEIQAAEGGPYGWSRVGEGTRRKWGRRAGCYGMKVSWGSWERCWGWGLARRKPRLHQRVGEGSLSCLGPLGLSYQFWALLPNGSAGFFCTAISGTFHQPPPHAVGNIRGWCCLRPDPLSPVV